MKSAVALAHSASKSGRVDTVKDHLESVAKRAAEYAEAFGAAEEARLAGLLHDLGKYGVLFQRRLEDKEAGIDHWSAGAWQAVSQYRSIAAALAVQGHHVGLRRAGKDDLGGLSPIKLKEHHPDGLRLSEPDPGVLLDMMKQDGLIAAEATEKLYNHVKYLKEEGLRAAAMLDVRMLFSALVDADFVETEAHFDAVGTEKHYRESGPALESGRALEVLLAHVRKLAQESQAAEHVNALRQDLFGACLSAASSPQGLFTLTAPTGAGKTLSMLAFALKQAVMYNLRRIVVVIPYLSIIEQTVKVYADLFSGHFGDNYVLEHHSLAGTHGMDDDREGIKPVQRLLAENWDAPIVVTTSVQFFESLFANRPSACRKLHRLARSVVLFDEAQTFPARLAVPTLATLSRLAERYGASVVFSTATQPAFSHLHESVAKYCACGWQPQEIVPANLRLFDRARRTEVKWPDLDSATSWDSVARQIASDDHKQVLCIVNLKRHALDLVARLEILGCSEDEIFHLSTSMCPAHRRLVLYCTRRRLRQGKPCRLVSTQCVEAGVDFDFPTVFRAWGPLDSIAQAAGRCNRNGRREVGTVHLFVPESESGRSYPDGSYEQAAGVAGVLLRMAGSVKLDIHDPGLFREYYRRLYDISRPENMLKELSEAVQGQDFKETAKLYQVIPGDTINVLVPWKAKMREYEKLADEVRRTGITRSWILRARPYTIGLYRPKRDAPVSRWLEPVVARYDRGEEDWFIYLNAEHYKPKTGLTVPDAMECIIG